MDSRALRIAAVVAAAASALLYYLIGFGVLDIGTSTSGTPDLVGFGLIVGTTYVAMGVLIALFTSRWMLTLIGILDAAVIVGYFVMASIRVPPFEPWGLLVKACQIVLLLAIGMMLFAHPVEGRRHHHVEDVFTTHPG